MEKQVEVDIDAFTYTAKKLKKVNTRDKSPVGAPNIVGEMKRLAAERDDFEKNEFERSNARLYQILGEAYGQYKLAKTTDKLLKETVKSLVAILKAEGSRVQTNTLAINLFVRFVFRSDRQRAYNYSRTLQAAYAKDIKPADLPAFIEAEGGVEQCKKTVTKSVKTKAKEQTIANAMPLVEEMIAGDAGARIGQVSVAREMVADSCDEEMTFLIGKANKRGEIDIVSVVPGFSKGAANWAKKQLAMYLAVNQVAAEKQAKNTRKEASITKAVKVAKKSSSATETVGELLAQ
jgi:hypothetical protein